MNEAVILLPTYNERENIAHMVGEILAAAKGVDILIIDDNSPDGTGKIADDLSHKYSEVKVMHRTKKEGLGEAYKAGMQHVLGGSYNRIITMDADGSHSPEYLPAMLASKADLVIGSRYVVGGGIQNWEKWRYALSFGGNTYARLLTGLPIKDFTSGFMCCRVEHLRRIDFSKIHASGYAFLMEMKFNMIHTLHAKVQEIPIIFKNRRGGESKISNHIIREGLKTPLRLMVARFAK